MLRFENRDKAKRALYRSLDVLYELPGDYERLGSVYLWHLYNICDAIIYMCCEKNARNMGDDVFLSIKDFSKSSEFFGVNVTSEIKKAAKTVSSFEKVDLAKDYELRELFASKESVRTLLNWISSIGYFKPMIDDVLGQRFFREVFQL